MFISRRDFVLSSAATGLGLAQAGAARAQGGPGGPAVIASANGMPTAKREGAVDAAMRLLKHGADPLDAVVAGVSLVEDDPDDHSVGYGGLPNEDGVVELDASVMHGPTHKAGAVAALRNIRYPSRVARLVMQRTDHVLIVGEGALRFAKAHGFNEEDLLTEEARQIWLRWKETHSDNDDWIRPEADQEAARALETMRQDASPRESGEPRGPTGDGNPRRPTGGGSPGGRTGGGGGDVPFTWGTINCCALDASGNLAGVTTTSGLSYKIPGRVGDSPIIGAGLYVDNGVGAAGSTGRGEANLQNLSSFLAVEFMRQGMSPEEACLAVLGRVAERTEPRLRDENNRPAYDLRLYAIAKDGRVGGASMRGSANMAYHDGTQARLISIPGLFG